MIVLQNLDDLSGADLYALAKEIKYGKDSIGKPYETLKAEMQIIADEMNKRGKAVARKYNKSYYPVSVGKLLR